MKRFLISMLVASAFALGACLGRSQPSATATPLPLFTATQAAEAATATLASPATAAAGDTAAPTTTSTDTAVPASATPSAVVASATPAATATPDPNEAVGAVVYQDKLDGKGGWFWTFSDEVATFGVADGKLKGAMKAANSGWRFVAGPDTIQPGSQQVSLNAHSVSCGPNDEYGLMFRVKADENKPATYDGYLFNLRCDGMASFQVISGSQTTSVVGWTPSPAIKTGRPADNTILIWAAGSQFRFYANGQYLFSATDSTLSAGFYGVYLYDRTAGGETVTFDTLVAKAVAK